MSEEKQPKKVYPPVDNGGFTLYYDKFKGDKGLTIVSITKPKKRKKKK